MLTLLCRGLCVLMAMVLFSMALMLGTSFPGQVGPGDYLFWLSIAMCVSCVGGALSLLWPIWFEPLLKAWFEVRAAEKRAERTYGAELSCFPQEEGEARKRYGGLG